MTKAAATIAAILALLTGIVLGQIGSLGAPGLRPEPANTSVSARSLATVRSFYDRVNAFLASGDGEVESILAPEFVDHAGSRPDTRNAEELMAGLTATRAALPHLRLKVVDLRDLGVMVAVQLEIEPGPPADMLGFPVAALPATRAVEFLRIDRSTVAERWSNDDRLPGIAMELRAEFERTGDSLSGPAIERLSLAAGQKVALSGDGPVVLHVVRGQLLIGRLGIDPEGRQHSSNEPLDAGQLRTMDVNDRLLLHNLSDDEAEFWAFSLYGLYPSTSRLTGDPTAVATPGIETAALVYMPLQLPSSLPKGMRISVTQLTLPAGAWVAPHTPDVVEQIVVLDGALEASLQSGRALINTGDAQMQPFEGTEIASAGRGISASAIATVSYRVSSAQPATLLVMTIGPVPAAGQPAGNERLDAGDPKVETLG